MEQLPLWTEPQLGDTVKIEEKKTYMFQYATRQEVIEDTGLITLTEAVELWEKYLPDVKRNWDNIDSPQMVIWQDCDSEIDYHTELVDVDFRDCELRNGEFYRVVKTRINLQAKIKEQELKDD